MRQGQSEGCASESARFTQSAAVSRRFTPCGRMPKAPLCENLQRVERRQERERETSFQTRPRWRLSVRAVRSYGGLKMVQIFAFGVQFRLTDVSKLPFF